ncbi:MAG: nitroreductase family protein [Pirellulales bacterium]|nr:nitroreductase family protein [Pirellulales bacterium]
MNPAASLPETTLLSHRALVEAAVLAPTPDNNQPWRFVSRSDRLDVHLDTSRALPSDVNHMFDLVGLGAAIENISIAARGLGHETRVSVAPGTDDAAPIARLTFSPGGMPDPLAGHLASRATCRRMYSARPIDPAAIQRLTDAAGALADVHVNWIADRPRIRATAGILAASDRIRFEYEPFHNELFRQIRYSAEEAERTRDGLDLRTLDLPPGAGPLLRVLRDWRRMRLIHRLGLGRLLTLPSAVSVLRSGAIAVLSVAKPDTASFLAAGRAVQRLWLAADAEPLAVQPLGSLSIFFAHVQQYEGRKLNPAHRARIDRLIERFSQLVPETSGRTVTLLLRVGYSAPSRYRSLRRAVDDVYEEKTS